ncbi:Hypothetical predicted protein, partial [Olea europaea subsp. europaea]
DLSLSSHTQYKLAQMCTKLAHRRRGYFNLVHPRFLKLETSKVIKRRILSRIEIPSRRLQQKKGAKNELYDLIEQTLLKDVDEEVHEPSSKLMEGLKNLGGKKFEINAEGSAKSLTLPSLVDFSIFLKEF